jgi:hypothetical protein
MKKNMVKLAFVLGVSLMMTSCYTYTATVGKGSQTGVEVKRANHYVVYGLAPISVSNAKEMAGGAQDYDITITHTFIDGLLNGLTGGLYTPTTTIVKK